MEDRQKPAQNAEKKSFISSIIILPVKDGSGVVDFCRLLDKGLFTVKGI